MKKIFLAIVFILLMAMMISCGSEEENPGETTNSRETESTTTDVESSEAQSTDTDVETGKEEVLHKITWKDENGEVIKEEEVAEGNAVSFVYSKTDTDEFHYTVEGWSLTKGGSVLTDIPNSAYDAEYYAVVKSEKREYIVSFESNGGTQVQSITKEYGSTIAEPEKPKKENKKFVAWCLDENLETKAQFPLTLTKNVTLYACYNDVINIKALLSELMNGYNLNPYEYIPETMRPDYSANLVQRTSLITDYSDFVDVSKIESHGFGEQWQMILENLLQSSTFFNVLTVVEGVSNTSVATFNNYFDSNPSDTAQYKFAVGEYNVKIDFDGEIISYILEFQKDIPAIGNVKVQIAMNMDAKTKVKEVRIQLGDANALKYVIEKDKYSFAIKYLGVRRAQFTIEKGADGNVEGHINEFLTVAGKGINSSADFYITDKYISAVGNKASGIPGFTGIISEVYDYKTGKMIGYEVNEELKSIVYNTLWFDLDNVTGINNIKYKEKTDTESAEIYINNGTEAFTPKKVGGMSLKSLSRRFDIEFRTQYFYSYNQDTKEYEVISVKVPMLFIQEEYINDFASDIKATNNVEASVDYNSENVKKVMSDYDNLIDVFKSNKTAVTEQMIIDFIGEAKQF